METGDLRYSLLGSDVVNVYVGKTQTHQRLHQDLVCDHSAFFKAAFHGGFRESQIGGLYLPADNEDTFDVLVEWLYTKRLDDDQLTDWTLCDLYLQSDKFQIAKLQCLAMEAVRENFRLYQQAPTCGLVRRVFENTQESDPLRRYLTDVVAFMIRTGRAKTEDYKRILEARSPFAVELGKATEKLNGGKPRDPRPLIRTDYSVATHLLKRKQKRAREVMQQNQAP